MARAALCVVLCAVYCILANISIRLPSLKFPFPHAPPLLLSLATLLPSSSARFPLPSFSHSVHAYVPSSLFPFLNPPSLPPLPLTPSLTSSLRHSLHLLPPSPPSPCSLPHSPSFLAPSLPPSMPACLRPSNSMYNVCVVGKLHCIVYRLAMRDTETMGCSRQKNVSFQRPAVTFSERAPTTNPFLTKSKKSADRQGQRMRQKHGRRSYLSVGVGGDSHGLLEREPTRSNDRGLYSLKL